MLLHVAHQAKLDAPSKTGGASDRAAVRVQARKGNTAAIEILERHPMPDALEYLLDWSIELRAWRRSGMNGMEPITGTDVESWAHLFHREPTPLEAEGLLMMDRASINYDAFLPKDREEED